MIFFKYEKNILILILVLIILILFFLASKYIPSIKTNINLSTQTELDLSGQGLKEIPKYVFEQKTLEKLILSNNNLTGAVPGEIRFLSKLTYLDLSNNQMTGVPAEIGQLSNLITLNLSNNKLIGLPMELGNLKKLQLFDISGNNYSQNDLTTIVGKLGTTVTIVK